MVVKFFKNAEQQILWANSVYLKLISVKSDVCNGKLKFYVKGLWNEIQNYFFFCRKGDFSSVEIESCNKLLKNKKCDTFLWADVGSCTLVSLTPYIFHKLS